MKSFPSEKTLNDPIKRNLIDQMLTNLNMDLTTYMNTLNNSIIKEKQILTTIGKHMLLLNEHKVLYENLKTKYPERNLGTIYCYKHLSYFLFSILFLFFKIFSFTFFCFNIRSYSIK